MISATCFLRKSTITQFRTTLVWCAFILVSIQYFLSWHFENIDILCRYGAAACLIGSIDFTKWKKQNLLLTLFLVVAVAIRRYLIVWVLLTLVYQIVEYNIKLKELARCGFIIVSLILLIQIEGILLGILSNTGMIYVKSQQTIYDLGTGNANRCAGVFFDLVLLLYILIGNSRKYLFCFFCIIILLVGFKITGSRTSFLCTLLVIFLSICNWKNLISHKYKYIISLTPIIFFCLTFLLAFNFASDESVNEKMSGRLWYILRFTQDFSILNWIIGAPRIVDEPMDSAYLEIIHTGGILLAIFFCTNFMKSTLRHFDITKPYLPLILPMLVAGLTESIIMRPSVTSVPFWILIILPYFNYKFDYYRNLTSSI